MIKGNGPISVIQLVNIHFGQEEQATLMGRLFSHPVQKLLVFPAIASGSLIPQSPTQQQLNWETQLGLQGQMALRQRKLSLTECVQCQIGWICSVCPPAVPEAGQ